MPANAYALSLWLSGWTGSVSISDGVDTVTVTPTGYTSALRVVDQLIAAAEVEWPGAGWLWYLGTSGGGLGMLNLLNTSMDFELDASGNTATRLGISSLVPTGVSDQVYNADAKPTATLGTEGLLYADDFRDAQKPAALTYGGASGAVVPALEPRRPAVSVLLTAAQTVEWTEIAELAAYPGKVDIYQTGMVLTTYRLGALRPARNRGRLGHHDLPLEVLR